jgi:hypothetical protein
MASISLASADETSIADGDILMIYDASEGAINTMTRGNLFKQPAFHAYANSNHTATYAAFSVVQCDTEVADTDSIFNTGNYRLEITAATAGTWSLSGTVSVQITGLVTTFDHIGSIYKNGSEVIRGSRINNVTAPSTTVSPQSVVVGILTVSNGDYLELRTYQTSNLGTDQTILGGAPGLVSSFYGFRIRP